MRRDLARRLVEAEVASPEISWADQQAADHRRSLRSCAHWHGVVRECLRAMGVDPALAVTLRRGEQAAAELAAIPDTPELKAADEAILRSDRSGGHEGAYLFKAQIERVAEHYRSGQHQLDLGNASPAELLAFCVAAGMIGWDYG